MACTPQIQFASPQTGSCIPQELVDWLNAPGSVTIFTDCEPAGVVGIIVSPNPPGPDQLDQVWLRTDSSLTPLYLLAYWEGFWRRIGGVFIGAKVFYNGPISGVFDVTTGKGLVGGTADGWIIRYNNANKFFVCAEAYVGTTWVTSIDGSPLATGGNALKTLSLAEVPRPSRPAVIMGHANATGSTNTAAWTGVLYGTVGTAGSDVLLAADAGVASPTAFSLIPPYFASVEVEFIGINP